MANTWNRSGTTWGQGLWGEQDSNFINLTGVSASFSLGTVVSFSEQGWGRDDWGQEPWGESFDPVIAVTGFGLTASLGNSEEFNETGWGRLAWNDADWGEGRDETVSVTGFGLTTSLTAPTLDSSTAVCDFNDVSFTSASFTANGALIYNSSASNKAVAAIAFGGDKTVSSGTFTILFPAADASNAIIRLA